MARHCEKTDLDLLFKTREAFQMAEDHWTPRVANASARTILFVVEGPYCFEAAGTRSVYRSTQIRFDADSKLVVIEALPLHAQVYWESGWTHGITIQSLKYQPKEHRIVPRASLDITHGTLLVLSANDELTYLAQIYRHCRSVVGVRTSTKMV